MTDTIILHIDLKNYPLVYEQYNLNDTNKNQTVEGYMRYDVDGVVTQEQAVIKRGVFYSDSGKFLPVRNRLAINSPSHNYECRAFINGTMDTEIYLEVEMSLPKYFYGTNVFQLVPSGVHTSEANFIYLMKCIKRWIGAHLIQRIADEHIVIHRIDMCYNQFFNSKDEAIAYQQSQHDMQKHTIKSNKQGRFSDEQRDGHYNWMVVTDRYSFKCYHKGTEFQKHDIKELRKNKKQPYDLRELAAVADRVLRYEVTFRHTFLHSKMMYECFQTVEQTQPHLLNCNLYKYIHRVENQARSLYTSFFSSSVGGYEKPTDFFASRIKKFALKSQFDLPFNWLIIQADTCSFDFATYRTLFDFFWRKVKEVQVNRRQSLPELVAGIKKHQALLARKASNNLVKPGSMTKKGGVHFTRLLTAALLSQQGDIRELKHLIPERTYKRLMADCKACGIPYQSYATHIATPALDYSDNLMYCIPHIRKSPI